MCRRPARCAVPYAELSLRAGDTHTSKSTAVPSLQGKERESLEPGERGALASHRSWHRGARALRGREGWLFLPAAGSRKAGPLPLGLRKRRSAAAGQGRIPGEAPTSPTLQAVPARGPGGAAPAHGKWPGGRGPGPAGQQPPALETTQREDRRTCIPKAELCVRRSVVSDPLHPRGLPGSLSTGSPRQDYWSGLPSPSPGDLPGPGVEPTSLVSLASAGGFFTAKPPEGRSR